MAERAKSADSFVDSMEINVHLHHTQKVYYTGYDTIIKPKLLALGIRHVRDGINNSNSTYHARVNELGKLGIKFNFICPKTFDLSQLAAFASKVSGGLELFEGLNEWDLNGGSDWVNVLRTHQQSLYKTVKGNSSIAKFPVLAPSIVKPANNDLLGDISAYLDRGNMHNYPGGWYPGITNYKGIDAHRVNAAKNSGSKPVISTETGYHNGLKDTTGHLCCTEAVAGKYTPRSFLEHFNRNIRCYRYEFIDQGTNLSDREDNFGLLRNDGSAKPAYTALKNLISLLKDPGTSFSPSSLDYTLTGSTSDLHQTLLQKRDGRFYLILWLEKSCYNPDTKALITVPSQQVTLTLNTSISKAVTYLPNSSISGTVQAITQNQLLLNVPDHPLVVELIPALL